MPTRIPRGRGRGRGGATPSTRQPSDTAAAQEPGTAVAIDAVTPKQEDDDDEEEDEAKPPTTSDNTPAPTESLQSVTAAGYVPNRLHLHVRRADIDLPVQQRPHKMLQTRLSDLRYSDSAA
jgi:hypothetical protein